MSELNRDEKDSESESQQARIEVGGHVETFEEVSPKRALKQLRSVIKDFEDYQTVPNRRKTDSQFRKFVQSSMNQTNDRIKEIHALLIEKQQMSTWAVAERLINEAAFFAREVEKGDYGFTTFFENP